MRRPNDRETPNNRVDPANGGWTEVNRRRWKMGPRWDNDTETTFFIENLPEEATNNLLWKLFGKVGRLSDAYIAKKKDNAGNRFGFLRFWNVKNIDRILEDANRIRVNEAVVKVSLARFDRNHRKFSHTMVEPPKKQESYNQEPLRMDMGEKLQEGRRFMPGGLSYKEVVKNQATSSPEKRTVRINGEEGLLQRHWIGKAVLGEVKGIASFIEVRSTLDDMNLGDVGVRYVGGMKMLISFHDKGQALDFINNGRQKWGKVFETAKLWNGDDMVTERIVKLYIMGVPILLRDDESFIEIGKSYGRVVGHSEFSWSSEDASMGSCIVVINQWDKIDEVINVEWKNRKFVVKVVEETWRPTFKETVGLEEGEVPQPSSEKMGMGTRFSKGVGGSRLGWEKDAMHGEGTKCNEGGCFEQSFNHEGGGDDFVIGVDSIRKKKRKRVCRSVDPSPSNSKDLGQKKIGPEIEGNGLVGGISFNHDGPFVFNSNSNQVSSKTINNKEGDGEVNNEKTKESVESCIAGVEGDVVMEPSEPVVRPESDPVETEVNNTMRIGESLGVPLEAFKKDVEELVIGDGVFDSI